MINKLKVIFEWTICIVLIFCAILIPLAIYGGSAVAEELDAGDGTDGDYIVEDTQESGGFGAWI